MDTVTKTLLVEVARTVLRVLGEEAKSSVPVSTLTILTPVVTARDDAAPVPTPAAELGPMRRSAQHGDAVRFWNGNMWCVGKVVSVCRKKEGKPPAVNVRVEKPNGRGKSYKVEIARAEVVRAA